MAAAIGQAEAAAGPWSLGGRAGGLFADDGDVDRGAAAALHIGRQMAPRWYLQAVSAWSELSVTARSRVRDYERLGLGAEAVYGAGQIGRWPIVALGGLSLSRIEIGGASQWAPGLTAGFGGEYRLTPRWTLHPGLRYQLDFIRKEEGVLTDDVFYTWDLSIGLLYRLGAN